MKITQIKVEESVIFGEVGEGKTNKLCLFIKIVLLLQHTLCNICKNKIVVAKSEFII